MAAQMIVGDGDGDRGAACVARAGAQRLTAVDFARSIGDHVARCSDLMSPANGRAAAVTFFEDLVRQGPTARHLQDGRSLSAPPAGGRRHCRRPLYAAQNAQAGHMNVSGPIVKALANPLAQRGPSTHESDRLAKGDPVCETEPRPGCTSWRTVEVHNASPIYRKTAKNLDSGIVMVGRARPSRLRLRSDLKRCRCHVRA